jgi:hypothetical protein
VHVEAHVLEPGQAGDRVREVVVAMEPTGAYSTALRHQLTERGLPVFRVDPKRCHDVAAVLDGVPSQHDAKACTLIAYLHAQGISASGVSAARSRSRQDVSWPNMSCMLASRCPPTDISEAITAASWPELQRDDGAPHRVVLAAARGVLRTRRSHRLRGPKCAHC